MKESIWYIVTVGLLIGVAAGIFDLKVENATRGRQIKELQKQVHDQTELIQIYGKNEQQYKIRIEAQRKELHRMRWELIEYQTQNRKR